MKYLVITLSFLGLLSLVRLFLFVSYGPRVIDGQQLSFVTTILSEPQDMGNTLKCTVYLSNMFGSVPINVTIASSQKIQYGDVVRISGKVHVRLIGKRNPIITISFADIEAVDSPMKNILAIAGWFRQKVTHMYFDTLPAASASLLTGIVLGVKEPFSKDFQQALQTTGLMHVIAASGMNVTLVGAFLLGILSYFLPRKIALVLTSSGLLFYCLLAGLQASIIRATAMSIMMYGGQFFGRQYSGWYGLLFTGFVMIFISPQLLFDIGFQLSFTATAGILFIRPIIPKLFFFTDDIATTLAASIATLPILLGAFGQYGLLSLVANALVLWMVPLLMIVGGVRALVGFIVPFLGQVLLWMAYPLLLLFQYIVSFIGSLPFVVHIDSLPLSLIVGYYLLIISAVLFIQAKRS